MRIGRSISVVAIAALAFAACGSDDSKTIDTDKGSVSVSGDGDDAKVSVETDEGSGSFGAGTDLPDDFPTDDVPVPEDLELQSAVSSNSDQSFSLSYKVDEDDAESAISDYQDALEDAGFTIADDTSANFGGNQITNLRANGNGWIVTTSALSGGVNVLVVNVTKDDSGASG